LKLPSLLAKVRIPKYFSPSTFKDLVDCPLSVVHGLSEHELLPLNPKAVLGNIIHEVMYEVGLLELNSAQEAVHAAQDLFARILKAKENDLHEDEETSNLIPLRRAVGLTAWRDRIANFNRWVQSSSPLFVNRLEAPSTRSRTSLTNLDNDMRTSELFTGSEVPLYVPELRLAGRPDRLERRPDGIINVIDFKTGPIFGIEGRVKEQFILQLYLYALMIEAIDHGVSPRLWIQGTQLIELSWNIEVREETIEKLEGVATTLPENKFLDARMLAETGPQCFRCRIRHRCPKYHDVASNWWLETSISKKVAPFDIWGRVSRVYKQGGTADQIEIKDAAGRNVRITGLNSRFKYMDIAPGKEIYFFGLQPSENFRSHGIFKHPQNFHGSAPSNAWADALQLKIYVGNSAQ
jgi:hypothetical protein